MSDKPADISFSQEYQLLQPSPERAYPVPVAAWNRLIERIELIGAENRFFESLGWGMFGVSASALLAAITLPNSVSDLPQLVPVVILAVFAVSGAISTMSFIFAHLRRQDRTSMRKTVLEDMRSIQERFELAEEPVLASLVELARRARKYQPAQEEAAPNIPDLPKTE